LVMAERLIEYAAVAIAPNPAQAVVVIRARILLEALVALAHLRVIDAREHVHILARPRGLVERVDLVDRVERLALERGVDRIRRVVDLHGDRRRVPPVIFEVPADHLVEIGPERRAAAARLVVAMRTWRKRSLCRRGCWRTARRRATSRRRGRRCR